MTNPFWCLYGKDHTWVPTGSARKIAWTSNTYADIPDDVPEEQEERCAVCGETRWQHTTLARSREAG